MPPSDPSFESPPSSELTCSGSLLTWEMSDVELAVLIESLTSVVKRHGASSSLPKLMKSASFPYRDSNDALALISDDITQNLRMLKQPADQRFRCYQCGMEMDVNRVRVHVGKHILFFIRGIDEALNGIPVGLPLPCGFCGRSGIQTCAEVYLMKQKAPQARSNCRHQHKFNYAPSLVSNVSTPCTNVPIECLIPGCRAEVGSNITAVWKYNMPEHIWLCHPGYSSDGIEDGVPVPAAMARAMLITHEEEEMIGIPSDKIPPKDHLISYSNASENNIPTKPSRGKRQIRATTSSSTARHLKKHKSV
ncbi:hypothetical protein HYDPIDRAFT_32370 [Hydnomerulius pinastri MD-312]|uniref:Unplaced genomic scaffold scaffold_40, whole genome shotgun sequence n=1 Tax=Hydnomerulius pinastri MD-312 TaxID=994086 RepID=A0A0C9VR59_9AGAM|nr:hypothetical protein HYDPIDRAFT_32370 [Hydnomerulius pinastri MD-312]